MWEEGPGLPPGLSSVHTAIYPRAFRRSGSVAPRVPLGRQAPATGSDASWIREHRVTLHLGCEVAELATQAMWQALPSEQVTVYLGPCSYFVSLQAADCFPEESGMSFCGDNPGAALHLARAERNRSPASQVSSQCANKALSLAVGHELLTGGLELTPDFTALYLLKCHVSPRSMLSPPLRGVHCWSRTSLEWGRPLGAECAPDPSSPRCPAGPVSGGR